MERKKVSVTKANLALEDLVHHQEMERKKVSVTKANLALLINQNRLVLQITLNTLAKKQLKIHQIVKIVKVQALVERRNLKVEVIDLKALHSKNTAKKELKSKIF